MTAASVAEVLALFDDYGGHTYDEVVTQTAHAEQTAAQAVAAGASDALVVAALLHDVGHLLELRRGAIGAELGRDLRHDVTGPAWLAELFPAAVTDPIALHVQAKRYRCAVDPGYHDHLSPGSQASLVRQGGPFDAEGVVAFESHPGWADAVRLREWDDAGKVLDLGSEPQLVAPDDEERRLTRQQPEAAHGPAHSVAAGDGERRNPRQVAVLVVPLASYRPLLERLSR